MGQGLDLLCPHPRPWVGNSFFKGSCDERMDVGGSVWPLQSEWAICFWSAMDMWNYDHFTTVCDKIIWGFPFCLIVITEVLAKHVQSEDLNFENAVG